MEDGCSKNVSKRMHPNKDYNILLNKLIDGTISDSERWELDRASLDDPFLADTLEGLYDNAVDTKPKFLLSDISKSRQLSWYKPFMVAASMVLLLGFSFLIIRNTGDDERAIVAESSNEARPEISTKRTAEKNSDIYADRSVSDEENLEFESEPKPQAADVEIKESKKISQTKPVVEKSAKRKAKQKQTTEKEIKNDPQIREEIAEEIKENEEEVNSITDDISMDVAKVAPPGQTDSKMRSKVTAVNGVPIKKQNLISGYVYDEGGAPISKAVVKNESDTDSSLTDATGFFALELEGDDRNILVRSQGFTPQAQAVRPELSITLKKAQSQLSQRPMLLVETLDAGELEREYSKILDDGLREPFSICPQEKTTVRRIKMRINISNEGRLLNLDYLTDLSENCQRIIEDKIIQMSLEGAFRGKEAVIFNYDFRL